MVHLQELQNFIAKKGEVSIYDVAEEFNITYKNAWRNIKTLKSYGNLVCSYRQEMRNNRPFVVYYYSIKKKS